MKSLFDIRIMAVVLLIGVLSACGGSGGSSSTPTAEEPADPTTLSGIAAFGAALDGATVEIVDANGNLVDIPDTLTGSDGSYQVELPSAVALPVIVRVTPPGGTPLLTIVPPPADGSTEVIANINPITDLVSATALGDADSTDNVALSAALASVDTGTLQSAGDQVVEKVLGSSVKYSSFASDPDFVAKTADGTTPPSAADAILDTLAKQATSSGTNLKTQLKSLNDASTPSKLLEEPAFQIGLVGEMIKGGTAAGDLETSLSSIGAIKEPETGEGGVFRAVIEVVPALIQTVRDESTTIASDEDLLDVATDAVVDLLAGTINEKKTRYATDANGLVSVLKSSSLQETVSEVVQSSVVPVLAAFEGSDTDVKQNLATVTGQIVEQAATVVSTFQYTETSSDVSDLVSEYVAQNVAPTAPLTEEDLQSVADGTATVVRDVGDVNEVQISIQTFAGDNADLVEEPIENLIQSVPPGTWGESAWDSFNWG